MARKKELPNTFEITLHLEGVHISDLFFATWHYDVGLGEWTLRKSNIIILIREAVEKAIGIQIDSFYDLYDDHGYMLIQTDEDESNEFILRFGKV